MAEKRDDVRELEKELELYKTIVDVAFEGVLATDKDGTIVVYNQEIARTERMDPKDVIGKKEHEVYTDEDYHFPELLEEAILPEGKPLIEQRYFYKDPHGEQHHIIYSAYPYYYDGEYQGLFSIGRDVMQINSFLDATLKLENQLKKKERGETDGARYFLDQIVGSSLGIRNCVRSAEKIASHDVPVMIIGETGTGKELFAQGIHNASPWMKGPFVSVNCAALPETLLESILFGTSKGSYTGAVDMPGLFEQAEDGSLFLDEINSMPLPLQSKLLRVIQEKRVRRLGSKKETPVNCRIISAANRDPFDLHAEEPSQIRSDLLFRLSTSVIHIPPLRERKEDIPELCEHFLRGSEQSKSIFLWEISPDLLNLFYHYDWPGNVRELENIIVSSLIFADNQERFLKREHVPDHLIQRFRDPKGETVLTFSSVSTLKEMTADFERSVITEAILAENGNISKAAKRLALSRQNLYVKIHKYHLEHLLKNNVNKT